MIEKARVVSTAGIPYPLPDTAVLQKRRLNPEADPATFSVYADDRWNLTPGFFESHVSAISLNLEAVPPEFRDAVKRYYWCLINEHAPRRIRNGQVSRVSLQTIANGFRGFVSFVEWLHKNGIQMFCDVRPGLLELYQSDILAADVSDGKKGIMFAEVVRFWSYRAILPEDIRMPAPPPWDGENTRDLLGTIAKSGVNLTPRINSDTIDLLLLWALRFVETFSDDIISAFHDHLTLWRPSLGSKEAGRERPPCQRLTHAMLENYLKSLRCSGNTLPGRRSRTGELEIDYAHVARVLKIHHQALGKPWTAGHRRMIENSGIPVSDHVPVGGPIAGLIGDRPWLGRQVGYTEAEPMAELLRTACFIVIAYLSGMRPGEVLNLERGCLSRKSQTGIWLVEGRKFKGAVDQDGEKVPEGLVREDPWVVVDEAAKAVQVLERLHEQRLLFANDLNPRKHCGGATVRVRTGRSSTTIATDIIKFIDWVNRFADENGRDAEVIPPDPEGRIAPSRFRRTLAWHIVRKPRGLIAGAIQYGHVHVQMTLGYSGSYQSGFPDERAFEEWLYRLEQLGEDFDGLRSGEHVSGPAAPVYRNRVEAAHHKFGGRVLKNTQQARDMLSNPLLQIFPGRAMTCVFDPDKALCQMRTSEGDKTVTPDQTDCRPNCRNKAYTDRDIAELEGELVALKKLQGASLAPSPRNQRMAATIERFQTIVDRHTNGAAEMDSA